MSYRDADASDDLFRTLHSDDTLFAGRTLTTRVNVDAVWALYHLLRGGVPADHESLEKAIDVRRGRLSGVDLDELYREADDLWPHVDATGSTLAACYWVQCGHCRRLCNVVPCVPCSLLGANPVVWLPDEHGVFLRFRTRNVRKIARERARKSKSV